MIAEDDPRRCQHCKGIHPLCDCPARIVKPPPITEEQDRRTRQLLWEAVQRSRRTKPADTRQKTLLDVPARSRRTTYSAAERKAYGELMRAKRQREEGCAPRSTPILKSHLYSGKTKPPE